MAEQPAGRVEQAVAAYFAAIRAMDAEQWLAVFADDAVVEDPVGAPLMNGKAALRQFFDGICGAFHRVGLDENHVFVCGNEAAVKWTGYGIGKNGKEVSFEGIDIIEVGADGKISATKGYWNPAAMMAQLQG